MGDEPPVRIAWLASWGRIRFGSCKILFPSREALTSCVQDQLRLHGHDIGNECSMESIFGLVRFRYRGRFGPMTVLSHIDQEQVSFWKHFTLLQVCNRLCFFDVVDHFLLPELVPLQQCTSSKRRGNVILAEEGQPQRIFGSIELPSWLRGKQPPERIVRVPAPYASLVCAGAWPAFSLFELSNLPEDENGGGASAFEIDWNRLGIAKPGDLPDAVSPAPV